MKIFLTGSTSFIGKNLYEFLTKNYYLKYKIIAPSHSDLDLTDENYVDKFIRKNNFDIIIHAAMYNENFHHPDMLNKSLKMFFNLEKNKKYFDKMFYFGSGAEFDKTRDIASIKEENFGEFIPKNYYGFAKYIMNKMALKSNNIYNLRLFGVYGKYEDWKTKFISNACYNLLTKNKIIINQNVFFDYLYIEDLCKITENMINLNLSYHDYNVCSGKRIDLLTIAKKLIKISHNRTAKIYIKNEGLNKEYTALNIRLLKEIDFKFTDINTGIKNLYEWYKDKKIFK